MTVSHSLDAYLEPTRLSFSSPPVSELTQEEESYPVFSPLHQSRKQSLQSNVVPPSGALVNAPTTTSSGTNTLQPGSFVRQHRRQSSVNTVSWTDQGDATTGRVRRLSTTLNPSNVSCFLLLNFCDLQFLDNVCAYFKLLTLAGKGNWWRGSYFEAKASQTIIVGSFHSKWWYAGFTSTGQLCFLMGTTRCWLWPRWNVDTHWTQSAM